MIVMKKLLVMLVLGCGWLPAATLHDVRTVYIFPMSNALDQYLASELTQQHIFEVVSDPKAADAVFTDRVGPSFEQTFDQRVLGEKLKGGEDRPHTSMGRKGALFLVNKSKQVVWSTPDDSKDSSRKQMERTARRSVARLKKDLFPKSTRS